MSDEGLYPVGDELGMGATVRGFIEGQRLFDRYVLQRILGRGGMGVVWLAMDEKLDRNVAMKFLPELIKLDSAALDDLKRETRRSLELTHPHIVRIHDFVDDATAAAISMEYVDGHTLSSRRVQQPNRVFEVDQIREWIDQLIEALDYAHRKAKLVHRDLKSSNLMINAAGDLKVADFGIARSISDSVSRVSMRGGSSGTLAYMSPQQARGADASVHDDIYAFGATLYELLTSKPPFYSGNIQHQLDSIVPPAMAQRRNALEIEGAEIPNEWQETIAACLEKEPSARPQSIAEIAERLGLRAAPATTAAKVLPPPSVVELPTPEAPLRPKLEIGLILTIVAVVLIAIVFFIYLVMQSGATIQSANAFAPTQAEQEKANADEVQREQFAQQQAALEKQKADATAALAAAQAKSDEEKVALEKQQQAAEARAAAAEQATQQAKADAEKLQQATQAKADTEKAGEAAAAQTVPITIPAPNDENSLSAKARLPDDMRDTAQQAADLFKAGRYDDAAAEYQVIIDKYPDSLYAWSNLGVDRFQQGKFDLALTALQQAVKLSPTDAFSYSNLGIVYYQLNQYENAIDALNSAKALDPNDAKTHNYLGCAESQKGWQDVAEKEFRKALEIDPDFGDAHFNLALVYATAKPPELELARTEYNRAQELGIAKDARLEKLLNPSAPSGSGEPSNAAAIPSETIQSNVKTLQQQFLDIYLETNDAEHLEKNGNNQGALSKYKDCYSKLSAIHNSAPAWESALVTHRLEDCKTKIDQLQPQ